MEYVRLGRTGLKVSRLCLGCMTYGEPKRGAHEWTLNEEASRPLLRQVQRSARHWMRRGRRRIAVVGEPELLASEKDECPLRRRLLGRLRRRLRRPARHRHGIARRAAEATGR